MSKERPSYRYYNILHVVFGLVFLALAAIAARQQLGFKYVMDPFLLFLWWLGVLKLVVVSVMMRRRYTKEAEEGRKDESTSRAKNKDS